jgi:hypothetical protein
MRRCKKAESTLREQCILVTGAESRFGESKYRRNPGAGSPSRLRSTAAPAALTRSTVAAITSSLDGASREFHDDVAILERHRGVIIACVERPIHIPASISPPWRRLPAAGRLPSRLELPARRYRSAERQHGRSSPAIFQTAIEPIPPLVPPGDPITSVLRRGAAVSRVRIL